jgi:4-alpha-glucanotransferase
MKVLQFAWSDAENEYLPHNYQRNCVVYSATHDNDTTVGWFSATSPADRHSVHVYTGASGSDIAWDFIRLAFTSVGNIAIVPLQDVLSLGTHARMNMPGRPQGNWGWRFREGVLSEALAQKLRNLTAATRRLPQRGAAGPQEEPPTHHA